MTSSRPTRLTREERATTVSRSEARAAAAGPPAGERWGVRSEVGTLRRVLVHRPGPELSEITPGNKEALLFDDVPRLAGAQGEHDALTGALERLGVEVLYLRHLLAAVLGEQAARREVIAAACDSAAPEDGWAACLAAHLDSLPADQLADQLIGGVHERDLASFAGGGRAGVASSRRGPPLAPVPNHVFTRDGSAWVGSCVHLGTMALPARRRESAHLAAVYRYHSAFAGLDPASIRSYGDCLEGGDLLVVNDRCVLAGAGDRTSVAALRALARQVFEDGVKEVIVVGLPTGRSFMHLDTVLTMVDHDSFTVFPGAFEHGQVWRIRPGPGEPRFSEERSLGDALRQATGGPVQLIPTGGDASRQRSEQWTDANSAPHDERTLIVVSRSPHPVLGS